MTVAPDIMNDNFKIRNVTYNFRNETTKLRGYLLSMKLDAYSLELQLKLGISEVELDYQDEVRKYLICQQY